MKQAKIVAAALIVASSFATGAVVASNDPAATGRVLMSNGGVLIQRSVKTDTALVGSIIGVGDTVLTTDTGTSQWQMSDESLFAIAPNSGLKINKYALSEQGRAGVASYALLQGSVHTITGKIGKTVAANVPRNIYSAATAQFNPANLIKVVAAPTGPYMLKTALAVITTQGADYVASQAGKVLKVLVHAGSVTACTIAGCASPVAGEGVVVNCEGCKPTVVPGITLGLDALYASLQFNLQDASGIVVGAQVNDPRADGSSPTLACRTVAAQLQAAVACGPTGPTTPVSPN